MMQFVGMEVAEVVEALEAMGVQYDLVDEGDGDGHFEFEAEGQFFAVYFGGGVVDEVESESADMGWDE